MANNDVQHLLDMLYEMIDGAKNAPLTSDKCILNRDEALDLLDEISNQLAGISNTAGRAHESAKSAHNRIDEHLEREHNIQTDRRRSNAET